MVVNLFVGEEMKKVHSMDNNWESKIKFTTIICGNFRFTNMQLWKKKFQCFQFNKEVE